ncbi:M23 family metallopeptidase [Candidatus Microgenomates bacterium]|nr:MAG: M23 family metallopeptidase [Candidatus Microgenomates bacterium]
MLVYGSILISLPKSRDIYVMKLFSFFKTIKGRQVASLWASRIFERSRIKQLFGANLVAAAIFTGVITPQATDIINQISIEQKMHATPIEAEIHTLTTFEKPLADYALSQGFSYWHPAIDLTAPSGTPIYAIDEGIVEFADNSYFGYGKHVIIAHDKNITSLYAHMSEIVTSAGKNVTRGEMIGKIGSTGWATGDHLHLEMYQNGTPINPLEVLPDKPEEIRLDGAFFVATQSAIASPSAIPAASS